VQLAKTSTAVPRSSLPISAQMTTATPSAGRKPFFNERRRSACRTQNHAATISMPHFASSLGWKP
jgi:hypothetical protein